MALFNFGKKQRLHAQLYGNTSGKEMFKVDEYNQRKQKTTFIIFYDLINFIMLYFWFKHIPIKFLIFMIIVLIGLNAYGYFNLKEQKILKESLY